MAFEMVMPKMGESIAEGTILKWFKKEGDSVEKDETILEISTDKVDSEIPSPVAGIIEKILIPEGDTVEVSTIIALIQTGSEPPENVISTNKVTPLEKEQPAKVESTVEREVEQSNLKPAIFEMMMPKMGESIAEGTILKWFKKEGDNVEKDETVLEVSTDKVDSEIPSSVTGVLKKILIPEGETVEVETVIALIETQDSLPQKSDKIEEIAQTLTVPISSVPQQPVDISIVGESTTDSTSIPRRGPNGRFYSPVVRNIATAERITFHELEKIPGSGLDSRLTKKDLMNYLKTRTIAPTSAISTTTPAFTGDVQVIPMDNMRKLIAKHMVASVKTSAHAGAMTEADVTKIVEYRERAKNDFFNREGIKLTYTPIVASAVIKAIKDYPMINASVDLEKGNFLLKKSINLGIAVALGDKGLIVPVVKNADTLNVAGLAHAINDLALKARNKKLLPDDVQGGTFTITNPGVFGNLIGMPIINQPEVCILCTGTIKKRPVVINDAIAIRSMMYLLVNFDHRLVDGELAGKFVERIVYYLENFQSE